MAKKLKEKEKLFIIDDAILPQLQNWTEQAVKLLEQAKDDWVQLNSIDGDRTKVKQPVGVTIVQAQAMVELALEAISEIKEVIKGA